MKEVTMSKQTAMQIMLDELLSHGYKIPFHLVEKCKELLAIEKEQIEISDEEIETASLTFAKEESYGELNADLWKGHLFGAKWYRKQLRLKGGQDE